MKQNLTAAGYRYIKYLGNRTHLLENIASGNFEIYFSNKNHASWGIVWKNTHLEFARSFSTKIFKRPERPADG